MQRQRPRGWRSRGPLRGPERHPGRQVMVVLATAILLAACSSDRSAPQHSSAPTTTVPARQNAPTAEPDPEAVAAALLPEVPSAAEAGVVEDGCDAIGMPGTIEPGPEDARFVARTAADGSAERVFGGINPRVEVSAVPFDQVPAQEEEAAAARFVAEVEAHIQARGWTDPAKVLADGYRPLQRCNTHLINLEYVLDGRVLDPERPEFVVLVPGHHGRTEIHAVMFLAGTNSGHGPQPFGPLAVWHYHEGTNCMVAGLVPVPGASNDCPSGSEPQARTPEMLHVSLMAQNPFDSGM